MNNKTYLNKKLNYLISIIYDEYNNPLSSQRYGLPALTIIDMYNRYSQDKADLDNIRLLKERGWIHIITISGVIVDKPRVDINTLIKPTSEGIQYVENLRKPWIKQNWKEITTIITEGIVRAFKRN